MKTVPFEKLSTNFHRSEFACPCGCGFDTVDSKLVDILQKIRNHYRARVIVTSGARCTEYNARVGGASDSQHIYGKAADIQVNRNRVPPTHVAALADTFMPDTGGIGEYPTHTHLDVRSDLARWTADGDWLNPSTGDPSDA